MYGKDRGEWVNGWTDEQMKEIVKMLNMWQMQLFGPIPDGKHLRQLLWHVDCWLKKSSLPLGNWLPLFFSFFFPPSFKRQKLLSRVSGLISSSGVLLTLSPFLLGFVSQSIQSPTWDLKMACVCNNCTFTEQKATTALLKLLAQLPYWT